MGAGERGFTRRRLIHSAAAGYAGLALGRATTPGWAARRPRALREGRFGSGVSAGFPGRRSVTLWTRVHEIDRDGRVEVEVAREPDFRRVVSRSEVTARAGRDFTAHVRVDGLDPGEEYHYRFATRERPSRAGRFRTLRPADSREPVRLGFFSCQGWQPGYFTAHSGLAREDLDAVVLLGDYIYERTDDDGPRRDRIGPNRDGEAQTLPEYRQKYHLYQGDPNLQDTHAAHAFVGVWDDHEMESGWRGRHEGETQGIPRRVPYRERVRNGMRAFFEHLPFDRFPRDPTRVYRSITFGRSAELLLLDLHQYGDDYPCGFSIPPRPCPEARDPRLTLLGARQKRWLKRRLSSSAASWKVLGNPVMMMSLDLYPGQTFNPGQWDGFEAERRELMEHVLAERIGGVTVVSGDIHTFFAGQVTTSGRIDGTPAATEFVGGSISSEGIAQGVSEALGLPEDTTATPLVTDRLMQTNPHYAYANTARRGYAVVEAGAEELRVEFRSPRTVLEPRSEVETLERFRVARSAPRVEFA